MKKVSDKIYVGCDQDCFHGDKDEWVVVHACKYSCYHKSVGNRILPSTHKNYLINEKENHLYLNMIDNANFKKEWTEPMIIKAIQFIEENIENKKILIHCNKGMSRSPGLALIFLAKITEEISNESYDDAKNEFLKLYPSYQPGRGVDDYLRKYWDDLQF